jgi:RNA polymerase sigma factor (sigma-70 family)
VEVKRQILERAMEEQRVPLLRWVAARLAHMGVLDNSRGRTRGDIAGDVLADACLAVLRHAERFDASRDPVVWIKAHAIHCAKRHREQVFAANRAPGERREVAASEMAGEEQSAEETLDTLAATRDLSLGLLCGRRATMLETQQALASLLEPLSSSERQVIVLSVFGEYDSPRLAAELGIAPPAARKRLQRALDRLRAHINSQPEQFSWIENSPTLLGQSVAKQSKSSRHKSGASNQHTGQGTAPILRSDARSRATEIPARELSAATAPQGGEASNE